MSLSNSRLSVWNQAQYEEMVKMVTSILGFIHIIFYNKVYCFTMILLMNVNKRLVVIAYILV